MKPKKQLVSGLNGKMVGRHLCLPTLIQLKMPWQKRKYESTFEGDSVAEK
jgi:hypothetical protein